MQFSVTGVSGVIKDIALSLRNIFNALVRPLWVEPSTARVRVSVEAGTLTTVSTVTTVNQIGGYDAKQGILTSLDRTNWAENVRRCIT
jgi:hypothetical protein